MPLVFTFRVELELTDEMQLRAAADAAGCQYDDSGDAAAGLLLLSVRERLTLPGTRVIGSTLAREHDFER